MRIFSGLFWRLAWLAVLLWLGVGLLFWALAWRDASQLETAFLWRRQESVATFLRLVAPDKENQRLVARAGESLFSFDRQIASVRVDVNSGIKLWAGVQAEEPNMHELLTIYGSQAALLAPLQRWLTNQNLALFPTGPEKITNIIQDQGSGLQAQYQVYGTQLNFLLVERLFSWLFNYGIVSLLFLFYFLLLVYVLWPIQQLRKGALAIASGDLSVEIPVRKADELGTIATFFNEVARNLNKVASDLAYKDRVAHELQLATQIQQKLLPKTMPQLTGLAVAARTVPAVEIGGDAYDFVTNERGDTLLYLGDVTGHGVPAALVMTMMNILLRAYHQVSANLTELFYRVNGTIFPRIERNMFMTAAGLLWQAQAQKLTYINAGQEPPLHYKHATKQCENIVNKGIALGMLPDNKAILKEVAIDLAVGDLLVLYSDGIIEATNNYDEDYGAERLQKALVRYGHRDDLLQVIEGILTDLRSFTGKNQTWADDVTLLVIKKI